MFKGVYAFLMERAHGFAQTLTYAQFQTVQNIVSKGGYAYLMERAESCARKKTALIQSNILVNARPMVLSDVFALLIAVVDKPGREQCALATKS